MNLTREVLVKTYPWAAAFSGEEQDQIIERLSNWGRTDVDTDTFLDKLIHSLIEQDIQLGHYRFGLQQTLEDADRTLWIKAEQVRAHFYKVIHHVE